MCQSRLDIFFEENIWDWERGTTKDDYSVIFAISNFVWHRQITTKDLITICKIMEKMRILPARLQICSTNGSGLIILFSIWQGKAVIGFLFIYIPNKN